MGLEESSCVYQDFMVDLKRGWRLLGRRLAPQLPLSFVSDHFIFLFGSISFFVTVVGYQAAVYHREFNKWRVKRAQERLIIAKKRLAAR